MLCRFLKTTANIMLRIPTFTYGPQRFDNFKKVAKSKIGLF